MPLSPIIRTFRFTLSIADDDYKDKQKLANIHGFVRVNATSQRFCACVVVRLLKISVVISNVVSTSVLISE